MDYLFANGYGELSKSAATLAFSQLLNIVSGILIFALALVTLHNEVFNQTEDILVVIKPLWNVACSDMVLGISTVLLSMSIALTLLFGKQQSKGFIVLMMIQSILFSTGALFLGVTTIVIALKINQDIEYFIETTCQDEQRNRKNVTSPDQSAFGHYHDGLIERFNEEKHHEIFCGEAFQDLMTPCGALLVALSVTCFIQFLVTLGWRRIPEANSFRRDQGIVLRFRSIDSEEDGLVEAEQDDDLSEQRHPQNRSSTPTYEESSDHTLVTARSNNTSLTSAGCENTVVTPATIEAVVEEDSREVEMQSQNSNPSDNSFFAVPMYFSLTDFIFWK